MKGGTVQVTWHGSDPVLSLDFHRLSGLLATGGADHDIKMWNIQQAENALLPSATFQISLSYHTAAVNVVRFSPAGDQLASGADGGEVLLWKLSENVDTPNTWKLVKNLRFHVKDVLDLEWSPDGNSLISGSVDNCVIIWDTLKGVPQQILKDHMHYVQGVAWDPAGQYLASLSGDRTCRIYCNKRPKNNSNEKGTFVCQNVLVKIEVSKQESDTPNSKETALKQNLFHDETLPSFFRRLAWSPDGSFLLVPSGVHKVPSDSSATNTAFIISRKDLSRPAVQLPGASKPIVAVRFCPVVFSLQPNKERHSEGDSSDTPAFKLPYRLVFAVASLNSVFIYDTQNSYPLAVLAGLHYAAITDIAWSWDAQFLAVSSQDGFCSLATFEQGELGNPLPLSELPFHVAEYLPLTKERQAEIVSKPVKDLPVFSESTNKVQFQRQLVKNPVVPDAMESGAVAKEVKDELQLQPCLTNREAMPKVQCESQLVKNPVAPDAIESGALAKEVKDELQLKPCLNNREADSSNMHTLNNEKPLIMKTQKDANLQTGSVKPRRITPVAIIADTTTHSNKNLT